MKIWRRILKKFMQSSHLHWVRYAVLSMPAIFLSDFPCDFLLFSKAYGFERWLLRLQPTLRLFGWCCHRYSNAFLDIRRRNYVWTTCGHVEFERFRCLRRRRFHLARVSYYSNTCATFNMEYLLLSGDIKSNPGPGPHRAVERARYSGNHPSKTIIRCLSLSPRSICNKLGELHDVVRTRGANVVAITETCSIRE